VESKKKRFLSHEMTQTNGQFKQWGGGRLEGIVERVKLWISESVGWQNIFAAASANIYRGTLLSTLTAQTLGGNLIAFSAHPVNAELNVITFKYTLELLATWHDWNGRECNLVGKVIGKNYSVSATKCGKVRAKLIGMNPTGLRSTIGHPFWQL